MKEVCKVIIPAGRQKSAAEDILKIIAFLHFSLSLALILMGTSVL
jgi:hypothetical protein